jgi:hypothetical protein
MLEVALCRIGDPESATKQGLSEGKNDRREGKNSVLPATATETASCQACLGSVAGTRYVVACRRESGVR